MDQCNDISSTSDPNQGGNGGTKQTSSATVPPQEKMPNSNGSSKVCAITKCGKITDELKPAPLHALTYYGFTNSKVIKICLSCLSKADKSLNDSVNAILRGECIFKANQGLQYDPDVVDLCDDEEMEDASYVSDPSDQTMVNIDKHDVPELVEKILKGIDIKGQVEACTQQAEVEANELANDMDELEDMLNQVDDQLLDTLKRYNQFVEPRSEPIVIQEVDIGADGSIRRSNLVKPLDRNVFISRESKRKLAEKKKEDIKTDSVSKPGEDPSLSKVSQVASEAAAEFDTLNSAIPSTSAVRKAGPASKTGYCKVVYVSSDQSKTKESEMETGSTKALLPIPKVIPRIQPKIGGHVYAMDNSLLNYWLSGQILETIHNAQLNQLEFLVEYDRIEPKKRTKRKGARDQEEENFRVLRQMSLKELAYNLPCPFILPVGSRIIGKFRDDLKINPGSDGQYYAGIVAESPKLGNKNRYLVFFDDGYAQYINPDGVLLVCESSQQVWIDVYPEASDFIKEYLTRFPEYPMARLSEGSMITTEWNGSWYVARVLEVDCSLAKVIFEDDSREEWIYRGAPRFRPIYKALQYKKNSSSRPRHNAAQYRNRNDPTIEYNNYFDVTERKTARKSTSKAQVFPLSNQTENHINMGHPDLYIEYQGSISKLRIPESAPKPKKYVPHECKSECVHEFTTLKDFAKCSPLAIPLFLGWNRELTSSPRQEVSYRTPCGIMIANYDELYVYLAKTNSNLFVDFFCFEYKVNHLAQFVPERIFTTIFDISYGKEPRPIHCVNSVDYDQLPFMDYTPYRVTGDGVTICTDDGFLACCDCTDNCQDKSKCACWKRTKEGICFSDKFLDPYGVLYKGYENRRLRDHIVSGIYECNSKCHCKRTCSNRVAQNGVTWPLQIFKTTKKGWGIRAMCDMPEGTFICIYSGQILPEDLADKDGIENGDEYLAELDYIETVENTKEDYESDVTDIEADDCEDREEQAGSRSKRGNENPDSDVEMDTHEADTGFVSNVKVSKQTRSFPTRSTSGQKKKVTSSDKNGDALTARTASHFNPQIKPSKKKERPSLRMLYGPDEQCFIMDAKSKGNIGRYLNHSCNPNVFVQNVFVDSLDLRFPLVAFFTNTFVKAGTELTWDYHYQIGSVPGRTMYCYCESIHCRSRLL